MKKLKYILGITCSYFNDETDDLIADFKKEFEGRPGLISVEATIVETSESHISGTLRFEVVPEKNKHLIHQVFELIEENDLAGGECFSLYDQDENVIFTEDLDN